MRNKQSLLTGVLAGAVLMAGLAWTDDAQAVPMLRLTDGLGNSVTITDETPGDGNNGQPGVVNFNGTLSGNPGASSWTGFATVATTSVTATSGSVAGARAAATALNRGAAARVDASAPHRCGIHARESPHRLLNRVAPTKI